MVDDPHCQFTLLSNGTTVISYTGLLAAFDTPQRSCTGLNLLWANVLISSIGLLICISIFLSSAARLHGHAISIYNICMTINPLLYCFGFIWDIVGAVTYFQFWGNADLGQVAKLLFFLGSCVLVMVEGLRLETLLMLLQNRRRKLWVKIFTVVTALLAVGLGAGALTLFFIGAKNKSEATDYTFLLTNWYAYAGLTDTIISAVLVTLFYKYRKRVTREIVEGMGKFVRRFLYVSVFQALVIVAMAFLFNIASKLGKTYGRLTTLTFAIHNLGFYYSVILLQRFNTAPSHDSVTVLSSASGGIELAPPSSSRSHSDKVAFYNLSSSSYPRHIPSNAYSSAPYYDKD
ncbi:hypothetical protein HDU85_007640 [Gaertneriomyces sp. JEL0708]|nr:hypothetical protein HDU85_007640 [Gaertneriomyces sp. JEL0708]